MTQEIPKQEWKKFFDDLSKRRFEWQTKVEIINESIGDQILDKGLSLNGITVEEKGGRCSVEIIVGHDSDHHQTHTVVNPTKICYLGEDSSPSGVVELEEADGTKTLVYIIQPMPLVLKYVGEKEMTAMHSEN